MRRRGRRSRKRRRRRKGTRARTRKRTKNWSEKLMTAAKTFTKTPKHQQDLQPGNLPHYKAHTET